MSLHPDITGAVLAILSERRRQVERFGHTAAADDAMPHGHLLRQAHVRLIDAGDHLIGGHPRLEDLNRARGQAIQGAAIAVAAVESLDRQIRKIINEGDPA